MTTTQGMTVKANDPDFGSNDDIIQGRQKLNFVATIKSFYLNRVSVSHFYIPLCRIVAMPMVRPIISRDLKKLEQEFVHCYEEMAAIFYISVTNKEDNI